jgi:OOP family OmpA-OmpF porin
MITKYKYTLLAGAAAIVASSAAFATEPGAYIGLGLGLHLPSNTSGASQIPSGAPPANTTFTFDKGFIGAGTLGYKWDNSLRTELEMGYRQADFDEINGLTALGIQKVLALSANLLYDFDSASRLTPYVGVGLGVSSNKWKRAVATGTQFLDSRTTALQVQGIAGVSMKISDRVEGFADYRYIAAGKNRYSSSPPGSIVTGVKDRSHNILVGLRFALNAPQPAPVVEAPRASPPPPPPPPPPVASAPPPVPQKFLVFFDFDRATLRADAQRIISEAAAYAQKNGKARISATGHADTSGDSSYNLALSERRARAVIAELGKMGFSQDQVGVFYKGESEPLVSTGDSVKEPQNRRVEIVLE